jgi:glycosyltransferase involved in cell wall biosynthesis
VSANETLHVMQFATVFECGGTERQVLNLGRALHRRGAQVRFGCFKKGGRLAAELDETGLPVHEYRLRSLYSARAVRQAATLARDLARARVDVIHAYNVYGTVFAVPAARTARVPVVIASIRDCGLYLDARKRRAQRLACRFADLILANADGVKRWLIDDGYPADRIAVIRNGIEVDRFTHGAAERGATQRMLGLPAGTPLLATIGRLCPSKGIEQAIDAMTIVRTRHPDARLLIVGEGLRSVAGELHPDDTYRRQLETRARDAGVADRVIFLGYRADVADLLRDVSVTMQPSFTEGLSNSVLEEMAAGCTVVATPVGGTPEVIAHGETGMLTAAGDARALGTTVDALLDQPAVCDAMGRRAAQFVRDRLSVDAMTAETERVYRELLARKRSRGLARRAPAAVSAP